MNILFIHGNYPGQFRAVAANLAAQGHRVVYLSHPGTGKSWNLPGVSVRRFAPHREPNPATHAYLHVSEQAVLQGQAVLRAVATLLQEGFRPNCVIFHGGLGYGLFLPSLLHGAPLIGYFEWYFDPLQCEFFFGEDDLDHRLRLSMANLPILSELHGCTQAVTATEWQRQQFPAPLQPLLHVVHEGIATDVFCPAEPPLEAISLQGEWGGVTLSASDLVLTYATRGMEPLRGFPEFLLAVPELLRQFPRLQVVIAGDDRVAYSYSAPTHEGSWKQHLLAQLGSFEGRERLHFPGSLVYGEYIKLLQRSDLHCYFSRPYVPSWSLLEALACGCRLLINRSAATAVAAPMAFRQVDLDAPEGLAPALAEALAAIEEQGLQRQHRVNLLPKEFEYVSCIEKWLQLLASTTNGAGS